MSQMYIVVSGKVVLEKDDGCDVQEMRLGGIFGDVSLNSTGSCYPYAVRALIQTRCLVLAREDMEWFTKDLERKEKIENLKFIRKNKNFSLWKYEMTDRLACSSFRRTYAAGEYIFYQNAQSDFYYLIFEGIEMNSCNKRIILSELNLSLCLRSYRFG